MDYPADFGQIATPLHLNTFSGENMSGMSARKQLGSFSGTLASTAWPSGNLAMYLPFVIPFNYVVQRAFWINGASTANNMDIGIYSSDGTKLWASGSTAQSGANVVQYVSVSPEVLLRPGEYFIALAASGTSTLFMANAFTAIAGRMIGMYQQASAFALPATATFAAWAQTVYPVCGLTRTSSGF